MKLKTSLCFCIILLLLFCGNSFAQSQNVEKAKELWEKVITAKGGRENLYAVKNLVVSNKSFSPFENEEFQNSKYQEFFVLSGKWWFWTDDRPGFTLNIWQYDFENEVGYEIAEGNEVDINKPLKAASSQQIKSPEQLQREKLSGERFAFIKRKFFEKQLIYLMETKWFRPEINGLKTIKFKGRQVDVIDVLFNDLKIEYYIDPKTFLPFHIKRSVWFDYKKAFGAEDEFFVEDYIEIANVKFPQTIRRSKKTETKTSYQVNVKYDENLFNTPPTFKYGSDAWKPKVKE